MKSIRYEFRVKFQNGMEESFYCKNVTLAWANANIFAESKAWNPEIKTIEQYSTEGDCSLMHTFTEFTLTIK